ncbi:MAG TPA: helical backbone metal receptor [Burkholderiales bacterium]|nr:helical backbone metal receptor [Burkholderiales bacterium]
MHFARERDWTDAAGVRHAPARGAFRIVSLVPSLTELLCDLGLAPHLVGRTGFCVHPRATVRAIPKVGGTKSVDLARLRKIGPTHVIVNIDENEKPTVEEIARFVPHVVVTHPLHPLDNPALYGLLGGIFHRGAAAEALVRSFERAWRETALAAAGCPREKALYLIWKKPWMTVARDTYISTTLAAVGWDTVPEAGAGRYPEVAEQGLFAGGVRRVLLPSEPYRFRERDAIELRRAAPPHVKVSLIDGEMTSWYGSRAIAGLGYLVAFRRRLLAGEG